MLENEVKVEKKFHILHTEWSSGWGGQEQRIVLECRKAMERGHETLIACAKPDANGQPLFFQPNELPQPIR